ncbi:MULTISPECIES: DUF433 domain-containing protein [Leptospira]|uniref:DUF433 domain-containing protein n=2 Tax=Leptospira TaxID=171 RepID=A0A2N0AKC0_9LEPT|nr:MULTISPECIES: DUF433 domain-containing protein [Leptospira]MCG6146465.1 DUF433 domain-containing protein [Leptospira bandrabouensis]MCG6154013.1 DUF433 domain-containing protein [Leptospira bandrabouensis]MCG6161612.1 DUF433 domain-containing protein [Leptospira bandrabouensis]MCG6166052.1 DUF433 domain-containing protein [Leptospira bandrabouensis]MCW7459798.1 DUF433 domain-containing protein [Leptospira bandrabouensis]
MLDYRKYISFDKDVRGGKPCIRGMRITVYDILDYLASGMEYDEILREFPYLTKEDILASLAFAADQNKSILVA